jgi:uncharacterized protein (TIGR00369 family)
MNSENHYRALINMYHAAPMTKLFPPEIKIEQGKATISLMVKEDYFHVAQGLHGSVYFKLLDDASAFAAYSITQMFFAYTANFNINFTAPVTHGKITAVGELVKHEGKKLYTKSRLFNEEGLEVANAKGLFIQSSKIFIDIPSYKESLSFV